MQNAAEMRRLLVKNCEETINAHKRYAEVEIGRLKSDYHKKETELRELSYKLDASADQLSQTNKRLIGLQSDLDAMQTQQLTAKDELKDAHQQDILKSTEIVHLRERLEQTAEELHVKTQDFFDLERRNEDTIQKLTALQDSYDGLQAQFSQQQSMWKFMHQEADDQIVKLRQDAQSTLKSVQDQVVARQEENCELVSRLERARGNESKLKAEQKASLDEKHRLQQELAELRAAKTPDLSQLRSYAAARERQDKAEQRNERSSLGQHQGTQNQAMEKLPSDPKQDLQVTKDRNKFIRQNPSVIEMSNAQDYQSESSQPVLQVENSQPQDDELDTFTSLFEGRTEIEDLLDNEPDIVPESQDVQGTSLVRHPDSASGTRDIAILSMSQHVVKEGLGCTSRREQKPQDSSSVDFSSIASEDLMQMLKETRPISPAMLCGYERNYPKRGRSQKTVSEEVAQSDNNSVSEPRSSQSYDRPRSQANTASRMMPPENNSHRPRSRNGSSIFENQMSSQHSVYGKTSTKFASSNMNTPAFTQSRSSVKQTHSQHDLQNTHGTRSQPDILDTSVQEQGVKRKSPARDSEKEYGIKKPRISTQADRIVDTSGRRPNASKPSDAGSRWKAQDGSPYARQQSFGSHPKASTNSSNIQPRTSSRMTSPNDNYSSRQRPSSQAYAASYSQGLSVRLTRSKSMCINFT